MSFDTHRGAAMADPETLLQIHRHWSECPLKITKNDHPSHRQLKSEDDVKAEQSFYLAGRMRVEVAR